MKSLALPTKFLSYNIEEENNNQLNIASPNLATEFNQFGRKERMKDFVI